ncbi:MAG: membrane-bound lytic murein transglycosylase D [Granulosicoccus sp.]|jgi:membrane-bound lytic murein transglycosylase D
MSSALSKTRTTRPATQSNRSRRSRQHLRLHQRSHLSLSIALLIRASVAIIASSLFCLSIAQSTDVPEAATHNILLPELGNTPEFDRILLREISDHYIFDGKSTIVDESPITSVLDPQTAKVETQLPKPASPETVWEFVQQSRRIPIPDNERIENYRIEYRREALWITKILNRATPFVGHIVDALDARYLPVELALLPVIESGYQPHVQSGQYAAGIWQFIPMTAAEIGIKRTVWFDGRADIRESTTAAIDYLSYLNAEFHGDWLLTLAAYNAGPGRIRAAIRANSKKALPTDFWSLKLPPETYNYVPKFLALVAMLRHDVVDDFVIPAVDRGDGFELIDLGRRASIDKLAKLSGIDEKTLQILNAGLVHRVTPPDGPHTFYVWKGLGDVLNSSIAQANGQNLLTLPATHTVVSGDTISAIGELYGISQRRLRSMNALEDSKILIGQQLAVRKNADSMKSSIEYVVTIGDTLSAIAEKFAVRVKNIRDVKGDVLTTDLIHPGMTLSINIDESRSD